MKKVILICVIIAAAFTSQAQSNAAFNRFRASFPMLPNGYSPNIEQIAGNEPLNKDPWFSANHGISQSNTAYYPVGIVCEGEEYITFMYLIFTKYGDDAHFDFQLIKSNYEGKNKFLYNDQLRIAKTDQTYHETFKLKRKNGEYTFTVSYTSKVNDAKGKKKKTGSCN